MLQLYRVILNDIYTAARAIFTLSLWLTSWFHVNTKVQVSEKKRLSWIPKLNIWKKNLDCSTCKQGSTVLRKARLSSCPAGKTTFVNLLPKFTTKTFVPYNPSIGGLRDGGLGKENLTMYSRGLESNSVGPSSSSGSGGRYKNTYKSHDSHVTAPR